MVHNIISIDRLFVFAVLLIDYVSVPNLSLDVLEPWYFFVAIDEQSYRLPDGMILSP